MRKSINIGGKEREIFEGDRGGLFYYSGNQKRYLTDSQKKKLLKGSKVKNSSGRTSYPKSKFCKNSIDRRRAGKYVINLKTLNIVKADGKVGCEIDGPFYTKKEAEKELKKLKEKYSEKEYSEESEEIESEEIVLISRKLPSKLPKALDNDVEKEKQRIAQWEEELLREKERRVIEFTDQEKTHWAYNYSLERLPNQAFVFLIPERYDDIIDPEQLNADDSTDEDLLPSLTAWLQEHAQDYGVVPERGDVVQFSWHGYRNDGTFFVDIVRNLPIVINMNYNTDEYGGVPIQFCVPEFPIHYFDNVVRHNRQVNICEKYYKEIEDNLQIGVPPLQLYLRTQTLVPYSEFYGILIVGVLDDDYTNEQARTLFLKYYKDNSTNEYPLRGTVLEENVLFVLL